MEEDGPDAATSRSPISPINANARRSVTFADPQIATQGAQQHNVEHSTQENEQPNWKIVTTWAAVRLLRATGRFRELFGQTEGPHVFASACSDSGFVEFIRKRYREVHGREMESDKMMLFFVKSCYMEYFLEYTVDHVAVERSRMIEIQKKRKDPVRSPYLDESAAQMTVTREPNEEIIPSAPGPENIPSAPSEPEKITSALVQSPDVTSAPLGSLRPQNDIPWALDYIPSTLPLEKMPSLVEEFPSSSPTEKIQLVLKQETPENIPSTIEKTTPSAYLSSVASKDTPSAPKRTASSPIEIVVPKKPRSTESDAQTTLEEYLSELEVIKSRLKETRAREANTALGYIRGKPLADAFDQCTRDSKCAICLQGFTTEGWYVLGSCGHEYHMRCLLLHALCSRSCVVCEVDIPREFYLSVGLEKDMPCS